MSKQEEHWKDTSKLTVITLVLWFIFSIVVHAFGHSLNTISFLGFPLGYYMAAQGSLLAFVVIIFWSTGRQENIDTKHGFAEEE